MSQYLADGIETDPLTGHQTGRHMPQVEPPLLSIEVMMGGQLMVVDGVFDGQHLLFSSLRGLVTGIKKPARGGFDEGGLGVF